jgi:hypothetical protein
MVRGTIFGKGRQCMQPTSVVEGRGPLELVFLLTVRFVQPAARFGELLCALVQLL